MKKKTAVLSALFIAFSFLSNSVYCRYDESSLFETLNQNAVKLTDETSLDTLVKDASQHQLVLLGESTHGTSEYYYWRYLISKKLIEEYGFDFIVVEGDWPSFYIITQNLKYFAIDQDPDFSKLLVDNFNRWPQWMWANKETLELVEWLYSFNKDRKQDERVGIYGMDVYSKQESIKEVQAYLNSFDGIKHRQKADLLNCFQQYDFDGSNYARAIHFGAQGCEDKVLRVVNFFREQSSQLQEQGERSYFNAKQNALIVKNAEKHFRSAVRGNADSWNYRVGHFHKTINRLLDYYGNNSKGVVWAHNTHIGDARATSMGQQGSNNIGQLTRQNLGINNVYLIGFGCYEGKVLAGSSWGTRREIMIMPQAGTNSIENILSKFKLQDYYFIIDEELRTNQILSQHIGHRAVGVVYNPAREYPNNYVPTVMAGRYNAFIFIRETTPLTPLKD